MTYRIVKKKNRVDEEKIRAKTWQSVHNPVERSAKNLCFLLNWTYAQLWIIFSPLRSSRTAALHDCFALLQSDDGNAGRKRFERKQLAVARLQFKFRLDRNRTVSF